MARRRKQERQARLLALLQTKPFLTDEELARHFGVSVATVRLDRLELGVPEMRQRTRRLAQRAAQGPVGMPVEELVGTLRQLEPGRWAVSELQVSPEMAFATTGIVRGHFLFAQANSLAMVVVDMPGSLTASARLRFLRPVHVGDTLVARAVVATVQGPRCLVRVTSTVEGESVFDGRFSLSTASFLVSTYPGEGESGDGH